MIVSMNHDTPRNEQEGRQEPFRQETGRAGQEPQEGAPRFSPEKIARFWSRVNRDGPIIYPDLGKCWMWTGAINGRGYGSLVIDAKAMTPHKLAATLSMGTVPDGMYVCHRCDNPPCCNPDHLFIGTPLQNISDAYEKDRKGKITTLQKELVRSLLLQGMRNKDIASRAGIDYRMVTYFNTKWGLRETRRGPSNARALLAEHKEQP